MNKPLPILFLLGLLFLLFEAKPLPNLHSKKSSQKKFSKIKYESHPKEYYDELVDKGIRLDNLTEGHPPYPFYKKMNFTADKERRKEILQSFKKSQKKRKLSAEEQTLDNLGFFGLIQDRSTGRYNNIMKYITNSIKKEDSRFILYPYPFEYMKKTSEEPENIKVEEGGVFTLNQTSLKEQADKFEYITNISSVKIGKAKGIYDIDIAILSLVYEDNKGREQDLFTSANRFCEYFTNTISKTSTCLAGKNPYLE